MKRITGLYKFSDSDHLTTWLLYFSNSNSSPIVLWKQQQKSYLCINICFSTPRIVRYFSSIWCLRTIQCSSSHSRWKFDICTLLTQTKQVERNDTNTCNRSLIMSRVITLFEHHFLYCHSWLSVIIEKRVLLLIETRDVFKASVRTITMFNFCLCLVTSTCCLFFLKINIYCTIKY